MTADQEQFTADGYAVLRGVFPHAEMEDLRQAACAAEGFSGDLLSCPQLAHLVTDERILDIAKQLGCDPPVYFGDSTASFHTGPYGFHRDNVDREDLRAPDWNGEYPIIRLAVYLQDYSQHAGGLEVRPGTHLPGCRKDAAPVYLATSPGDVVVWNLRLLHSGFGGQHLPRSTHRRIALFLTFARPHRHLQRYLNYLQTRSFAVSRWRQFQPAESVLLQAKKVGLTVLNPQHLLDGRPDAGQHRGHVPLPY